MATSGSCGGILPSTSNNRKRVVLIIEKKLAILDCLKKGSTQEKVSREFGVGRSTIGDNQKSESKLRSFATTMDSLLWMLPPYPRHHFFHVHTVRLLL